ncbi:putative membrane protein [Clostridium bornimense]|uniref:Putative membrane protein n=1 Tax=Clostridium bornimense TaxID=1216932 RepID=W6S187_9CLOT|nr:hypothetical protein [Clostridium bornimense]CDM70488.1 putative membrane protein [Clostridium bornimense]
MKDRFDAILSKSRLNYVGKCTLLFTSIMLLSYVVICTCLGKNVFSNNFITIKVILIALINFIFFNLEYEFAKRVNNNEIKDYFVIGMIFTILYGILEFGLSFFILLWETFIYQSLGLWLLIILTGGFMLGLIMYLHDGEI